MRERKASIFGNVLLGMLLMMVFILLSASKVKAVSYVAGGDCGSDLKWSLDYDGNLYVYGEGTMTNYGVWDHSSRGWKEYLDQIKTVTLEKGVTTIGRAAFKGCENLTTVKLASTVTIIDSEAFAGCSSLSDISLPEGLKELGSSTFDGCTSLTSIKLPGTLTNLGVRGYGLSTFSNTGLTSITIPSSVQKMAGYCFTGCNNLRTAKIDGNNLEIPYEAFYGCSSLTTVTMGGGVTGIANEAFGKCTALSDLTIGRNVTYIGNSFFGCTSLRTVTIPNKVKEIKQINFQTPFGGCTALESVTFGASVETIGSKAFTGCTALKEIRFIGSAPDFVGDATFDGCGQITAYYPGSDATWDRSRLTNHGASRIDWVSWKPGLGYYAPVLNDVTITAKGVKVTWNQMSSAKGYQIWRKEGNGDWKLVKKISSASRKYWTDTKVTNAKRYTYRICGVSGSQVSQYSNSDYVYYLSRSSISVSGKSNRAIVKWTKTSGVNGYEIQYSQSKSFSTVRSIKVNRKKSYGSLRLSGRGYWYFRMRTYKTVNGTTYYSAWSTVKQIYY